QSILMDGLRLTGTTSAVDFGSSALYSQLVLNASITGHPMLAGLTGSPTVTSSPDSFTWGVPVAGSTLLASLLSPDTSKAAIFNYEQGASLYSQPTPLSAPERRVGFFLGASTATLLTAEGWKLFDAAVTWATRAP